MSEFLEKVNFGGLPMPVAATFGGPTDGKIFSAMGAVMADIGAVTKDRTNEHQRYKFRGIDEVYNAVHYSMVKHGVFCAPRVTDRNEEIFTGGKENKRQIRVTQALVFRMYADDGSWVDLGPVWGEGIDTSDKAINKTNSAAHKYAFLMAFCIPTKDLQDDSDKESPELPPPSPPPLAPKATKPQEAKPPPPPVKNLAPQAPPTLSEAQIKRLFSIATAAGWKLEEVRKVLVDVYKTQHSNMLSRVEYDELCNAMQTGITIQELLIAKGMAQEEHGD